MNKRLRTYGLSHQQMCVAENQLRIEAKREKKKIKNRKNNNNERNLMC